MKKLRLTLLLAVMGLPLSSFGATPDLGKTAPAAVPAGQLGTHTAINCCWLFMYGDWFCIPC